MNSATSLVIPLVFRALCVFVCLHHISILAIVDAAETGGTDLGFVPATIDIPFAYPDRPTVYVEIDGVVVPLLFDTGTKLSILLDTGPGSLPPGLVFSENQELLAQLDGKPKEYVQSGYLRYASSDEVVVGNSNPLAMQFRVYQAETDLGRDFQGALSPFQFGNTHVIEIINSKSMIRLIPHENWKPNINDLKVPLVILPRGIFIPLSQVDPPLWFQLDTGFSGELAVTPESKLAEILPVDGNDKDVLLRGWGKKIEMMPCTLPLMVLDYHDDSRLPDHSGGFLIFPEGYLLPPNYFPEETSLEIGGIVGAGFLAVHDYAIDLSNGWLYLVK